MVRKETFLAGVFYVVLAAAAVLASPAQERKVEPRPPYYPGRTVYPAPQAVAPPAFDGAAPGPMAWLSRTQSYSASRVSSSERKGGPRDNVWIPTTGEEFTLAEIQGPGAITHIWTTFRGKGRDLIIRMYWEGSGHPSVEAPIGDFFGVAMGVDADMMSLPIQVTSEGRSRNCWWYMPFRKSARITVAAVPPKDKTGQDTIPLYFYIDYQIFSRPVDDQNYFHARFQETDPAERGRPVKLLEAEGSGHFLGVVMGHRARTPGWFGEGDDIITVDGTVSFLGTGTEDYFCDAWGFRVFSSLYHGVPFLEGRDIGSRLSAYRFHLMDPIPFRKSFKFEIEHWPWITPWPNTGRDYFSSVGFWYQNEIHKAWPRLEKIVSNETWDPAKGRWSVPGSLEAEDLGILGYRSRFGKNVRPEVRLEMPNLSGDRMLAFDTGGEGEFTLLVPVEKDGLYTVKIYLVRAPDYGIATLGVNGRPAGAPMDAFLKTDDLTRPIWPPAEFSLSEVALKRGLNEFRFAVSEKNPSSEGYKIGIDCLVLETKGGPPAASSLTVEQFHPSLSHVESASENGLHSRSGLKVRPSTLLLGASDLTLSPLYQLVDFRSALMVSETSASEDGNLEERLRGGKPSSRSGRSRLRTVEKRERELKHKLFDGQASSPLTF